MILKHTITALLFLSTLFLHSQIISKEEVFQKVNYVNQNQAYSESLPQDSSCSLPLGIVKEIGGSRYVIAVDSARFTPTLATFSAYMAIEIPGTGEQLAFAARNVAFNPKGVNASNNTRLVLVSDHQINISSQITMIIPGNGKNYIEWDCNGFKAVHLNGYFLFNDGLLKPYAKKTNESKVKAEFEIHTDDIQNMVMTVAMTPFCVKGLDNLGFEVAKAVADWSVFSNASGMTFPIGYQHPYPENTNLWTGFYVQQLNVFLPEEISSKNGPTTLQANNFIIDKTGVSGNFQAYNVLSLNEGEMSSWSFSITQLGLNVANNHLNGGNIAGALQIPVMKESGFEYSALVQENPATQQMDYSFSVSPTNNIKLSAYSATLDIDPASKIMVTKTAGKFIPVADLSGEISFNGYNAKTGKLKFQNLIITHNSPYLQSGIFNFTTGNYNDNKAANYPVSIDNITLTVHPQFPAISFSVKLNFMENSDQGFAGEVNLGFLAKVVTMYDGKKELQFDRVKINDIKLQINTTTFSLNGMIMFKDNDPVYGKGFYGKIALAIEAGVPLAMETNVWFGKKENYRYFYYDGSFMYQVPIGYGLALYRFMGGIYYHMRQPNNGNNLAGNLYSPVFGSATNYIPDPTAGIGLKAGVTIGIMGNDKPFNGDVALEILFNAPEAGGGISMVKFTGDIFVLTAITERVNKPMTEIPIHGYSSMVYDFDNKIFHAVNGMDIHYNHVQGSSQMVFHRDENVWYLHVGTPQNRSMITVNGMATLGSYFMVGNKIEPAPALPPEIQNAFNVQNADRTNADLNSGKRIIFGVELRTGIEKKYGFDFFEVYGYFHNILGFDAMISKYNDPVCPYTGKKAGFNNWYMKGNAYAFFQGGVGVKGKISNQEFDFQVFSGSAAALLYAELPQPSYIRGQVHCYYNILNLANGEFDYSFEKGQQCGI